MSSFRAAIACQVGVVEVRNEKDGRTRLGVSHPHGMSAFAFLTDAEIDQLVTSLNAAIAQRDPS